MGDTVSGNQPKRTQMRAGGSSTHPAVARVEGAVEALIALTECATIERRSGNVIAYIERQRNRLEAEYADSLIDYTRFVRHLRELDLAESRVALNLLRRANRVSEQIIPEVRRCYAATEYAA
jgi:hypothetical protein